MRDRIESACPSCGVVVARSPYDIGSGPELCCASCDWCWGAEGQELQPLDLEQVERTRQALAAHREGRAVSLSHATGEWTIGTDEPNEDGLARFRQAIEEVEPEHLRNIARATATDARIMVSALKHGNVDAATELAQRIYDRHEPWDIGDTEQG